jgi:hypothetical protein
MNVDDLGVGVPSSILPFVNQLTALLPSIERAWLQRAIGSGQV